MINQPRHRIVQPLRRAMNGFQHGVGTNTISPRVQCLGNLVQVVADAPELASRGEDLDNDLSFTGNLSGCAVQVTRRGELLDRALAGWGRFLSTLKGATDG